MHNYLLYHLLHMTKRFLKHENYHKKKSKELKQQFNILFLNIFPANPFTSSKSYS